MRNTDKPHEMREDIRDNDLDLDIADQQVYSSTTIATDTGSSGVGLVASVTNLASETLHDLKFKETRGNELIPRSHIPPLSRKILALISCFYLLIGCGMIILGALIHGLYGRETHRHCPAIWWLGVPSIVLFSLSSYTYINKSRRYLFILSISGILLLFAQTAVMGSKGNFSTALYSVWPIHRSQGRGDQPICSKLRLWCYCQDYYHGVYSDLRMHNTEYIKTNSSGVQILWKNSGFRECDDVVNISELYFVDMFLFTCFIVTSLFCLVLGLMTTVASSELNIEFQPLEEDYNEQVSHVDIQAPIE